MDIFTLIDRVEVILHDHNETEDSCDEDVKDDLLKLFVEHVGCDRVEKAIKSIVLYDDDIATDLKTTVEELQVV